MNLLTDVLQSQITRLQEEIRGLASWRTGIVESVDPPTVLFPRDTVATPADTLTQQITPGQVVLTLTLLRRVWIIGVRGGSTFLPRLSKGTVDVEALASLSAVEIGVVFPANRFTQAPWVGVTNNGMSGALRHTVAARNITAAACTIRVANFTTGAGAAHTVGWVALQ